MLHSQTTHFVYWQMEKSTFSSVEVLRSLRSLNQVCLQREFMFTFPNSKTSHTKCKEMMMPPSQAFLNFQNFEAFFINLGRFTTFRRYPCCSTEPPSCRSTYIHVYMYLHLLYYSYFVTFFAGKLRYCGSLVKICKYERLWATQISYNIGFCRTHRLCGCPKMVEGTLYLLTCLTHT